MNGRSTDSGDGPDVLPAVMVMDSHAVGMIAVIRSLGRAGYRVHACAAGAGALGLKSRFASVAAVHPAYASADFLSWLSSYLHDNNISMIVPSEGFLHAVRESYALVEKLLPDVVPDEVWQRCMSKVESDSLLRADDQGRENLPFSRVIDRADQLESLRRELQREPAPYYVKADAGKAIAGGDAIVTRCLSVDEALATVTRLLPGYESIICQGYASGRKVGVSLWRHRGQFCGESMCVGIHMNPFHGGMMSLRETFWHEALLTDAKRKMALLGWEGVAMMEYKWDPESDRFWFIEINARYWGYLHLDLYAEKDFPLLQTNAFFGREEQALGPPRAGVQSRYLFPGDTGYLLSLLKSKERSWMQKFSAVAGFIGWTLNPMCRADLWFPGDRWLYLHALRNFFRR